MKTSVIIRIVCWTIIAFLLIGVLIWGITGKSFRFNLLPVSCFGRSIFNRDVYRSNFNSSFDLEEAGPYSPANSYSVSAEGITGINVSWVAGDITVTPYEGSTISFTESALNGIPQKLALRYAISGSTLTIQYHTSELSWLGLEGFWNSSKKLELLLPRSLAEKLGSLSVDTVSSDVNVSELKAENIELETVSGRIFISQSSANVLELSTTSGAVSAEAVSTPKLQTETVSGSVKVSGSFDDVRTESVSGSTRIESAVCPDKVRCSSVSGSSTLVIPENDGFTAAYDSVSGGFSCAFPATVSNDRATFGDGSASFRFESVSGSMRIEKVG